MCSTTIYACFKASCFSIEAETYWMKAERAMSKTVRSLATVSRAEFLLPNLGSLVMGLAWGAASPLNVVDTVVLVTLSFAVINLSSAIGAQVNTLSDYELDLKDDRKKQLVEALNEFGQKKLKCLLIIEFLSALTLVLLLVTIEGKPALLLLWVVGISLGCAYSALPLRLKSRSWLALGSLVLVLSILPTFFVYYTITTELNPLFLISLAGLTLTVYGLIVPTETRDYFGDKVMGIETMTVHLGLAKASLFGIALLVVGSMLMGTGLFFGLFYGHYPVLIVFLPAIAAAVFVVLRPYKRLYSLSKECESSNAANQVAKEIVDLSANNPKWIMLVTQSYSLTSIVLLLSKLLI